MYTQEDLEQELWTLEEAFYILHKSTNSPEPKQESQNGLYQGYITSVDAEYDERFVCPFFLDFKQKIERQIALNSLQKYDLPEHKIAVKPSELVKIIIEKNILELDDTIKHFYFPPNSKAQPISIAALEREYKRYIKIHNSSTPPPTWKDDQEEMKNLLGNKPTDKQIKDTRAKFAPEEWKKRGRKPRKS